MKPVWLHSYEEGVSHTIDPDKFSSLNDMFNWVFAQYAELPAFVSLGKTLTYAEVDKKSRHFAAFLTHGLGLVKGDRVAVMMPNLLQYPIAIIGILRAGCILVNVNILFDHKELSQQLWDSKANTLLILENYAHLAEKALPETKVKHVIVTKVGDELSSAKRLMIDIALKHIKRKIPKWHIKGYYKYKRSLKIGSTFPYKEVEVNNKDVALLQYTGGTTGMPKGAMLTHRNLQANVYQLTAWMQTKEPLILDRKEIVVTILPLFHIAAIVCCFLEFFYHGGLNILIANPLDTKGFIKAVKGYPFSMIAGVNRLFNALLNEPEFATVDFSGLKTSVSSGMLVQPAVAMSWKKLTKRTLIQAYSQTEATLGITCNPLHVEESYQSVGLPLPSTELSIRNDQGTELDFDYPGEIWVRGPQVMKGYWNNELVTKEVLTSDGWLKTGDIGIMDANGYVRIIDRKKDVIYVLGFQVFPSEVEAVISSMPEVKESVVLDSFDEVRGEIVKAFVVPNVENLTAEQVISYCKERLPYYKVPAIIEFRKDLPKNSLGKILRRALRSESWTFG